MSMNRNTILIWVHSQLILIPSQNRRNNYTNNIINKDQNKDISVVRFINLKFFVKLHHIFIVPKIYLVFNENIKNFIEKLHNLSPDLHKYASINRTIVSVKEFSATERYGIIYKNQILVTYLRLFEVIIFKRK